MKTIKVKLPRHAHLTEQDRIYLALERVARETQGKGYSFKPPEPQIIWLNKERKQ